MSSGDGNFPGAAVMGRRRVSDLLALLVNWVACPQMSGLRRIRLTITPPAFLGRGFLASLDGNGNVGPSDLLALLANSGPCP